MPRHFTSAANDFITCSAGNLTNATGAVTAAVIWYTSSTGSSQALLKAENSSNATVWLLNPFSDGVLYWTQSGFSGLQSYTANGWRLDAVTRSAGASQTVRGHAYTYDTPAWTHTNFGTVSDSTTGPVDHVTLGSGGTSQDLDGEIAVAAVWERLLSDGELESLPGALSAWQNLLPDALWVLNQPVAAGLTDSSGGGANQTTISGTSVSALEVPGFSYSGEQRVLAYRYGMLRDLRLVL